MSGQKFISEAPGSGGEWLFCRRLLARWAGTEERGQGHCDVWAQSIETHWSDRLVTAMAWHLGCLFKESWSFPSPVAQWGSNLVCHWADGVVEK